jgi:hypothetical protein
MGSNLISTTVRARNIQEAWGYVYEQAIEYSGNQDGYSGDFNTCSFTKDVTGMLSTKTKKEVDDLIEDTCDKREAWGYCIEQPVSNKNKVKSQVDVTPQKGARKWETIYQAVAHNMEARVVAKDKSQTECIKKARAYVEANPNTTVKVIIVKELIEGNSQCATVKYKKATTEKLGLYRFIGWAAC